MLAKTVEMVRARGGVYNSVTQSVLLYGSEIWVLTGGLLKVLEGFRHHAAKADHEDDGNMWGRRGVVIPPGGGCNEIHRTSSHRRLHQDMAGDHSIKCVLLPHL